MKKTPHALTRLFTLLLASLTILSISVAAAGTAGSSSDPLVTLSYLNEKFLPELMTRVDEKLAARTDTASKELRAQVDADIKQLEEKFDHIGRGREHRHGGQLCGRYDDERTGPLRCDRLRGHAACRHGVGRVALQPGPH